MTELTPEQWQQEAENEARRLRNVLDLGALADNANQMDDPFGLDAPSPVTTPGEYCAPSSPLDLTDAEASNPDADVGHGNSTRYIGAVAEGMQRALEIGQANGLYKKKLFPWQR